MSTEPGEEQERRGRNIRWMWDYFSIKDDDINKSVCDICAINQIHNLNSADLTNMRRHLAFNHTSIYRVAIKRQIIHWESHFERVQCSTHSTKVNIKCKHCDVSRNSSDKPYKILLRVSTGRTMESHLKEEHNVTKSDWEYLQGWRNTNTQDYYDLTEKPIKRTRSCKKCPRYKFRRSNLCIMLKHLIQDHQSDITFGSDSSSDKLLLPLKKLPKRLIQLNYPVNAATGRILQPSLSGNSVI